MKSRIFILSLLASVFSIIASAQCSYKNTALKASEYLSYNLYYNWQFVWVKAGTASLSTNATTYKGKSAFRSSLITRTNSRVDEIFRMRDTLLCYSTQDMVPLYYRKGASEGERYTVDENFYSYPDGRCQVKVHRQKKDGSHQYDTKTYDECLYDMINIFQRARSFNPTSWKKGHEVKFKVADGFKALPAKLVFRGKTTIKADNGKKYPCLELSYSETLDGKIKEIARFFVTDDEAHIPVRIDLFLRFGSAKAFLTNIKR